MMGRMRKNFIDLKQTGCVFVLVIQMCGCEIEFFTSFVVVKNVASSDTAFK